MEKRNNTTSTIRQRFITLILRGFFNLLYHQFAWVYDWIAAIVSLGAWKKWVFSVLPYLEGPRVLEIGFGPGHLQASLLQKNIFTVGMDESQQMGRLTYHRILRHNLSPQLILGNARGLPFQNESFSQVVLTFPAEFILKNSTYSEIYRVLDQKGEAIILPIAWITGRKPMERAASWLNRITGESPEWDEKFLDPIRRIGFDVHWDYIYFSSSKALLIQLKKQPLGN